MISEDRRLLNERFLKVFSLLEERGDVVKNDRDGRGMGDFAEKILGNRAYGHIVRAFLNSKDKRCIDYHHARKLCQEFGVNEAYLIEGTGTPFGFDLPKDKRAEAGNGKKSYGNILFTTVEAFAGSAVDPGGFAAREENEYFSIPGLGGGGLVAFPISGVSMEPVIQDGDIVICKELSSINEIKDNKIYAVKSNGAIWVKYVQRIANPKGRVTHLKMVSANHLEYDPFVEEVNEYMRLYQVVRRVSDL